jgi:hypothetical protein
MAAAATVPAETFKNCRRDKNIRIPPQLNTRVQLRITAKNKRTHDPDSPITPFSKIRLKNN